MYKFNVNTLICHEWNRRIWKANKVCIVCGWGWGGGGVVWPIGRGNIRKEHKRKPKRMIFFEIPWIDLGCRTRRLYLIPSTFRGRKSNKETI